MQKRFRQVANRYPRRVAEAYGGTKRAMRETDEQVAATVAEWEREPGARATRLAGDRSGRTRRNVTASARTVRTPVRTPS